MLNVVYCTDNKYIIPTAVSIKSMIENNTSVYLSIYILTAGVNEAGEQLLTSISKSSYCKIIVLPIVNKLDEYSRVKNKNTNNMTYARLLCEEMLPDSIDKVLYIDGDTLILGNICFLDDYVFEDELLCGVYDFSLSDYRVKSNIGYKRTEKYVNAGVMLINLKAWRNQHISEKCRNLLMNNCDYMLGDQDAINLVCKNKIKLLPVEYNMTGLSSIIPGKYYWLIMEHGVFLHYTKTQLCESQKNPIIIHYASEIFGKPWLSDSYPVYEEKWEKHRRAIGGSPKKTKRIYSANTYLSTYKRLAEAVLYPFYKHKQYGVVALLYRTLYMVPHVLQFILWRMKCL